MGGPPGVYEPRRLLGDLLVSVHVIGWNRLFQVQSVRLRRACSLDVPDRSGITAVDAGAQIDYAVRAERHLRLARRIRATTCRGTTAPEWWQPRRKPLPAPNAVWKYRRFCHLVWDMPELSRLRTEACAATGRRRGNSARNPVCCDGRGNDCPGAKQDYINQGRREQPHEDRQIRCPACTCRQCMIASW